jgi:hypothetical protein
MLLSLLISLIIIKKIYNLLFGKSNKKYINAKYDINEQMLPTITAYYVGLN